MWQKGKDKKYHLLLNYIGKNVRILPVRCACGVKFEDLDESLIGYVLDYRERCEVCNGVWNLVYTSVADAKHNLKCVTNLEVLDRAALLTKSSTLLKAIDARIRKVKKERSVCDASI